MFWGLKTNKKFFFLLFSLIILLGLFSPTLTFAQFGWIGGFLSIILCPLTAGGVYLTLLFVKLANNILNAVLDPRFIPGGYIRNTFVMESWRIVRDFANMGFVLVLIYIGLATALRYREHQAKKTLPRLIAIAILINFTPVICGVVIDAANIFMNFFFAAGAGGSSLIVTKTASLSNAIASELWSYVLRGFQAFGTIFRALIVMFFNVIVAFTLLLFAGLFILRHLALWILIIISPLAFFAYILPSTRDWFKRWWHHFTQWAFVGVVGAFFLYLGQLFLITVENLINFGGAASQVIGTEFGFLLTYSVPVIFLLAGFRIALSSSAVGARFVTKRVEAMSGALKDVTLKQLQRGGRYLKSKTREKLIPQKVQEKISKLESVAWGEGERGLKGWGKRRISWVARQIGRGARTVAGGARAENALLNAAYNEAKAEKDVHVLLRKFRSAKTTAEKLGILQAMGDNELLEVALNPEMVGAGSVLRPEELLPLYQRTKFLGRKDLQKAIEVSTLANPQARLSLAKLYAQSKNIQPMEGESQEAYQKRIQQIYTNYVVSRLKSKEDFEKLPDKIVSDEMFIEAAMQMTPHQINQAIAALGKDFLARLHSEANQRGAIHFLEPDRETGEMRSPNLPKYFFSSPSLPPIKGASTEEEMKKIKELHQLGTELQTKLLAAKNASDPIQALEQFRQEVGNMFRQEKDPVKKKYILAWLNTANYQLTKLTRAQKSETPPTPPPAGRQIQTPPSTKQQPPSSPGPAGRRIP